MTNSGRNLTPQDMIELLETTLLGDAPTLTSDGVAALSGVSKEVARSRWRSLGFTQVPDGEIAFTMADVHAVQLTERLHEVGFADEENEAALIRTVGRSFARIAEFQTGLLARAFDVAEMSPEQFAKVSSEVAPLLEDLMTYVWRRHAMAAGARLALAGMEDGLEQTMAVGFADIVGYTARSRTMGAHEIADLVEQFDGRAQEIVGGHGGRIIKTIGDEVLFVSDDPHIAALIGLELAELSDTEEEFPQMRVGLTWGPVLARLGDVYGPVVNLASRLTSVAKPGRIVIDRRLADELMDAPDLRLRRMRRTMVKGYRHVEPWSLKRPRSERVVGG